MRSYHLKYHHLYDETALNEINQRFRIGKLRVLLKSVKSKCQLYYVKTRTPFPSHRKWVLYLKPIMVTIGRSCHKRWVFIVTCLTIRAVHLEVSHSLSTDSFILSLKSFMARRGCPREIYSDNGTHFRNAAAEIRAFMTDVDNLELVAEQFIRSETSWKFNPPASPHMGGSWERMVRSIKNEHLEGYHPSEESTRCAAAHYVVGMWNGCELETLDLCCSRHRFIRSAHPKSLPVRIIFMR